MKKIKRILLLAFVLSVLLGCLMLHASAATVASGSCGGEGDGRNLSWVLDSNGTLTITGTGAMENNTDIYGRTPWYVHRDSIQKVVLTNGVTTIGEQMFCHCKNLTAVEIPSSVTSIGEEAFYKCTSLPSLILPESVTFIGSWAFYFCTSLTSVHIPDNVTAIGEYTFYGCTKLDSITIPNGVTSIGENAFTRCQKLASIVIPGTVTTIGNKAFYECYGLTDLTLKDGIRSIGDQAFYYCRELTGVTIPDSVTYLGSEAFNLCKKMTSATIGDGVTAINRRTFEDCDALAFVNIGSGVTAIGDYAFQNCAMSSVTIPDSVTTIGYCAFEYCYDLTSIELSNNLVSIGEWAFRNCTALVEINFPSSLKTIGAYAFYRCNTLTDVTIPDNVTSIGDYAFYECYHLSSLVIGNGIIAIPNYMAHNCRELTSVTISDSVTSIGNNAFSSCIGLTVISLPDGITTIGKNAFSGCNNLTEISIPASLTTIGNTAFYGCKITSVQLPAGVTAIGVRAFYSTSLKSIEVDDGNLYYCDQDGVLFNKDMTELIVFPASSGTRNYTIPDGVSTLHSYAFSTSRNLRSVVIPDGVTTIGEFAFENCSNLTAVVIPEGVTEIGQRTFSSCSYLVQVTIPDSVTTIGDYAFANCCFPALDIPAGVVTIGKDVFNGNSKLACITVDENNTCYSDVDGVLFNKSKTELLKFPCAKQLSAYTVPETVTTIGPSAFYYCKGLTSVILPETVSEIGSIAFRSCSSLTDICFKGNAPAINSSSKPFDTETATLYYLPTTTGWTDSAAYDAEAGTWNGCKLAVWEEKCAAKIGNVYYATLAEAVEAAAKSDTIILLNNSDEAITIGKELVISKNGFTATGITAAEGYEVLETASAYTIAEINYEITEPDPENPNPGPTISGGNTDPNSNKSEIDIPVNVIIKVRGEGDKNIDLTINCGIAGITFDSTALEEIVNNALDAAQIQLSVEKDKDKKPANNGAEIFEINLTVKGSSEGIWSGSDNMGSAEVKIHMGKKKTSVKVFYVDENGNSQKIDDARIEDGYVIFTAKHFSTYEIVAIEGIASVNGTVYDTLAEALAAADDEIILLANTDEAVEVSKSLNIIKNGFTASGLTAAEGWILTETEDAYTVTAESAEEIPYQFTTSMTASLELESEVFLNVAPQLTDLEGAALTAAQAQAVEGNVGMLIWDAATAPAEADATIDVCDNIILGATYNTTTGRFDIKSAGIAAKNLGDSLTIRSFYKDGDQVIYGKYVASYSATKYCYNQINKSAATKDVCIALLNYGAAAQVYFDHNTDNMMNSELTAAQQTIAWTDDLVRSSWTVDAAKEGELTRQNPPVSSRAGTLELEGAINVVFTGGATGITVDKAQLLIWNEADFAANEVLSAENATEVVDMNLRADGKYEYTYTGVPAKGMFDIIYACQMYTDAEGNVYYGGVLPFCAERYGYMNYNKTDAKVANLAKTMIVYGAAAREYFG